MIKMGNAINNYLHELHLTQLVEGEREKYKEEMKMFFPTLFNNWKGRWEMLLPGLTKELTAETKVMRSYIKGFDTKIHMHSAAMRNAYTYPSFSSADSANALIIPN